MKVTYFFIVSGYSLSFLGLIYIVLYIREFFADKHVISLNVTDYLISCLLIGIGMALIGISMILKHCIKNDY